MLTFNCDTLLNRLRDIERNPVTSVLVILTCHLSAMATPFLILHLRNVWLKSGLFLLALVSLTFEAAIFRVMGELPTYHDFLNLFDVAFEAGNAVSEYGDDLLRSVISIGAVLMTLLLARWSARHGRSWLKPFLEPAQIAQPWLLLSACGLVVSTAFTGVFHLRGNDATRGLTPGYGLPLALLIRSADSATRGKAPVAQEVSSNTARAHHILFIIDESTQFGVLNELWSATPQSRITGPPLPMLSYANSSASSNVLMRYACDPRYPERTMSGEGLLWKAKKAGYRVIYYDNQGILRRRYNFFGMREQCCIDEHHAADPREIGNDMKCLPDIIDNLQRSREPTFVLINKSGSHFTYEDNFKPEQALPGEPAYYTSVRVTTVEFLQGLVDSGVLDHTSIYYTSDHGQDWQKKVPHGSADPDECLRVQWEVPAFVLKPGDRTSTRQRTSNHWLSHFHLVETLNNELGYDDPLVPSIDQATDAKYDLNGAHRAFLVYPFETLGQKPLRKVFSRELQDVSMNPADGNDNNGAQSADLRL